MEQRSANSCQMTINERKFIEKALLSELRVDGHRPFDYRQLTIKFGSEEGSSEVQLGQTHVMAFVTSQLVQPYRDRPNEGTLSIFTEFSPMVKTKQQNLYLASTTTDAFPISQQIGVLVAIASIEVRKNSKEDQYWIHAFNGDVSRLPA